MELPSSMLPPKKSPRNKLVKNLESQFFQIFKTKLKKSKRTLKLTRVETWVSPGVPDLLICDEKGLFHFVELKVTGTNVVRLSAHQTSWLTLHKNSSSWILVRQHRIREKHSSVFVYHAKNAVELSEQGLKVKPKLFLHGVFDWELIFNLMCPI